MFNRSFGKLMSLLVFFGFSFFIMGTAFAGYKGYVRDNVIITPKQLKALMDKKEPKLVILAVARLDQYLRGHIPGAIRVWRPDYEPPKNKPFPFEGMIINRIQFQKFARRLGIDNDSIVVIYDHKYDATRLWWAFFLYGKRDCKVLDGGFQAWEAAGYPVDHLRRGKPKKVGNFVAKDPLPGWTASMEDVWRAKTDPEIQLWDDREWNEWTGAKLKHGAFRKGRIPWAKFLNWKEFKMPVKKGEPPTAFKPASEVLKVIKKHGMDRNKDQIFYCQSGVRTTTPIFVLYMLGWDVNKLHNFDGSWIEWSYYKENPVVCEKCK